ncbi:MAG: uncharacterized protein QOJ29_3902 [Thermoleophilaceae bacterium]|jgi:uncharacterized protein YciI|nr:uncharacterized protein [Thermoleophilaceae bacterium]
MEVTVTRLYALIYDYVDDDVLERRAPHRELHIRMVRERLADGRLIMAGALGDDPPHGGLLVFADAGEAEEFAEADPYVTSGLVRAWRVDPWQTVS